MSKVLFTLMKVLLILLLAIGCTPPVRSSMSTQVSTTSTAAPPATILPVTLTSTSYTSSITPNEDVLTHTLIIEDYQYMMECSGAGNPVTLLLGGRAAAWKPIQKEINRHARTCVFDHTGSRPAPLTAQEIAKNVHILIKEAEINGTYVLVGSSVGGYITRLFASLYPEEVVGVVFLDSSHPDQNTRFLDALPPEIANDCQELNDYRSELQGSHLLQVAPQIQLDFDQSADEVRSISGELGNLPLVVLTAGRSDWPDCFPPQVIQELDQAWLNMQEELKRLSSNSVQILAKESGHAFDDPAGMQAVIESIRRVIEAVRNGVSIQ